MHKIENKSLWKDEMSYGSDNSQDTFRSYCRRVYCTHNFIKFTLCCWYPQDTYIRVYCTLNGPNIIMKFRPYVMLVISQDTCGPYCRRVYCTYINIVMKCTLWWWYQQDTFRPYCRQVFCTHNFIKFTLAGYIPGHMYVRVYCTHITLYIIMKLRLYVMLVISPGHMQALL